MTTRRLIDVDLTDRADGKVPAWDSGSSTHVYVPSATGDVATDAIWDAAGDTVVGTGANTAARRKNAVAQTASPTVNDDTGDGYEIGSMWYDTTNDEMWVCMDASSGAAVWKELTHHTTATFGPWHISDLPGSATTQGTLLYMPTTTSVIQETGTGADLFPRSPGKIIGLVLISDEARTAGTATARVRVGGSGTAFNGGAVVLDGTTTVRNSSFVPRASGVAFSNVQAIGVDVVTASWTPTTANVTLWLVVSFDSL